MISKHEYTDIPIISYLYLGLRCFFKPLWQDSILQSIRDLSKLCLVHHVVLSKARLILALIKTWQFFFWATYYILLNQQKWISWDNHTSEPTKGVISSPNNGKVTEPSCDCDSIWPTHRPSHWANTQSPFPVAAHRAWEPLGHRVYSHCKINFHGIPFWNI